MSLEDALKSLNEAHGPKALAAAFGRLQGQVRSARKAAGRSLGTLAQTFTEAMRLWDAQKADGVSEADRVAGLEKTLRAAWPQTREWKYLCSACNDTGLVLHVCRKSQRCPGISTRTDGPHDAPGKYQRLCARHPESNYEHEYGAPCEWCKAGSRFKAKPKGDEDFTQSAGAAKKRGFTRFGR